MFIIQDFRWGLVLKILYNKFTHKNHIWHNKKHGGIPTCTHVCVHMCECINIYLLKRLETLKNVSQFNVKERFLQNVKKRFLQYVFNTFIFNLKITLKKLFCKTLKNVFNTFIFNLKITLKKRFYKTFKNVFVPLGLGQYNSPPTCWI